MGEDGNTSISKLLDIEITSQRTNHRSWSGSYGKRKGYFDFSRTRKPPVSNSLEWHGMVNRNGKDAEGSVGGTKEPT